MKQGIKIVVLGIGMCVFSIALMLILDLYILTNIGNFTFSVFDKFLEIGLTPMDRNLVNFSPLIITLTLLILKNSEIKTYVKTILYTLASIVSFLFTGIIIGLITWTNKEGSLLPDYIKHQPINEYWTVFISIGILTPLFYIIYHKRRFS